MTPIIEQLPRCFVPCLQLRNDSWHQMADEADFGEIRYVGCGHIYRQTFSGWVAQWRILLITNYRHLDEAQLASAAERPSFQPAGPRFYSTPLQPPPPFLNLVNRTQDKFLLISTFPPPICFPFFFLIFLPSCFLPISLSYFLIFSELCLLIHSFLELSYISITFQSLVQRLNA